VGTRLVRLRWARTRAVTSLFQTEVAVAKFAPAEAGGPGGGDGGLEVEPFNSSSTNILPASAAKLCQRKRVCVLIEAEPGIGKEGVEPDRRGRRAPDHRHSFVMLELPRAMRTRLLWCITLYLLLHPRLWAQTVTTQLPPPQSNPATTAAPASIDNLPDDPSLQSSLPEARVVPQTPQGVPVKLVYNNQKRESLPHGNLYTLDGDVVIYYRNYIVHADQATYNDGTSEIDARGHMMIDGGPDDEHFLADHGTINADADTGDFFDVEGTLGVERNPRGRMVFTSPNPFALTGREVLQLGQGKYRVIHGTMTSCRLPKPDWRILSQTIELNNGVAKTSNGLFEMFGVPLFYLPFVTHPVNEQRESGILLPYFGNNTTKGMVVGEGFYLTLGRSADLTMATQ
jgi:LPS-assembly protein